MNKKAYKIRYAVTEDAFNISELSRQLGYPASEFDIKNRLRYMMKIQFYTSLKHYPLSFNLCELN